MSLLDIFKADHIQKQIIKKFVGTMQSKGITKVLITINADGTIDSNPLQDDSVIIDKKDFDFYVKFVNDNKDRLTKKPL